MLVFVAICVPSELCVLPAWADYLDFLFRVIKPQVNTQCNPNPTLPVACSIGRHAHGLPVGEG